MSQKRESVNGIIFDKGQKRVLLIKRRDIPVWVLPGGGIEENETPEEAVRRELEEETGYSVTITRKIAEYYPISRLAGFTHFYECSIESGQPTTGPETADIQFFDVHNLPYKLPPPYPDWIQDAMSFSKNLLKKPILSVNYYALLKNLIFHPILVMRFLFTKIIKNTYN